MKVLDIIAIFVLYSDFCHQINAGGPSKCYSCNDTCTDPVEQIECPQNTTDNWGCFSKKIISGPWPTETRGCISLTDDFLRSCESANDLPETTCYTCATDLCNNDNVVTRCYSCQDTCYDPPDVESCPDNCDTEYTCMSYRQGNDITSAVVQKGCVQKSAGIAKICQNLNDKDGSCYICDQNLCNIEKVQQCYSCDNTCSDPPQIEDCPSTCENDYACMSYTFVEGGVTVTEKGCIAKAKKSRIAQGLCESINQKNGTCYFCDENLCNEQS